jgi:hypothetical protein
MGGDKQSSFFVETNIDKEKKFYNFRQVSML